MVRNPPAVQETQVQSLGQEGPLEERTATHSSVLDCRILWTEEPGDHSPWGRKESDRTEQLLSVYTNYGAQWVPTIAKCVA